MLFRSTSDDVARLFYSTVDRLTATQALIAAGDVFDHDLVLVGAYWDGAAEVKVYREVVRDFADPDELGKETIDYSHLLMRPYPERLVKTAKLRDGKEVILRPIKPEDEPLWLEMLGTCSKDSIYHRFRYDFHYKSHEIATEFCYIDYDREMAIVAEVEENGKRLLIGEGRLIADPDLEMAEYAVLVADRWQKKDLGFLLTEYCLQIARIAGVKRVAAETTTDNKAMLNLFKKLEFTLIFNEDTTVTISKVLKH